MMRTMRRHAIFICIADSFFERVTDFFRRFTDHFLHAHHDCPPTQPSGSSEETRNPTAPSGVDGHSSGSSNNNGPGEGSQCAGGTDDGNHAHGWWMGTDWTNPGCPPLCNLPGPAGTDGNHSGDGQASQSEINGVHSDQRLGSNLTLLVQAMASHFVTGTGFDPEL